ncbi:MAG: type II and III secretion system protein [Candidatus Brocadiaceae bacterium]
MSAAEGTQFGRDIPLEGLSEQAAREVYEMVLHDALVKLDYSRSREQPPTQAGALTHHRSLSRTDAQGGERFLVLGLKSYATQAARFYLWGKVISGEREAVNPDLDVLARAATDAASAATESPRTFTVRELRRKTYQLSCVDVETAVKTLQKLGFNTGVPSGPLSAEKLPVVFGLDQKKMTSVVPIQEEKTERLEQATISGPEERLVILYHGAQTEELARLEAVLEEIVDVPARQVLIEGMVIELTEDDYKELGAEWELFGDEWRKVTFLPEENRIPFILTYNPEYTPPADLAERIRTTVRMVIEEGRAEVLSSPSVFVLDNRNARIAVTEDVPIIEESVISDSRSKFNVRFEQVGIELNIKPRISRDGATVAMQVIAEVSEAPEFLERGGEEVAPLINRRKVSTIARVRDNTPFIIGGLIRNQEATELDRIPWISRIPVLGRLFQRRTDSREKREVIIVLTPRVMPTEGTNRPVLPKDTSRFDFLDNRLFRNSYRVKADDVFDLGFLENNRTIRRAFADARRLVNRHPEYATQSPFRELAAGVIPGEDAVVVRMIYEIVKKLELHEAVKPENLIFFQKEAPVPLGTGMGWLRAELASASPEGTLESFFGQPYPKRVPVLHFKVPPGGTLQDGLRSKSVQLQWVEVEGEDAARTLQERLCSIKEVGKEPCPETALVLCTPEELAQFERAAREHPAELAFSEKKLRTPAGFSVSWLKGVLADASPAGTLESYFARGYPKEVIVFHFDLAPTGGLQTALQTPVGELERVELASEDDAGDLRDRLIEINSLGEDYAYHSFAFPMIDQGDLERLRRAVAIREIIKVNNFEERLELREFRVGRRIVIPELGGEDERVFLVDHHVAELFFKSDYYYAALKDKLEKGYQLMDEALTMEGM